MQIEELSLLDWRFKNHLNDTTLNTVETDQDIAQRIFLWSNCPIAER